MIFNKGDRVRIKEHPGWIGEIWSGRVVGGGEIYEVYLIEAGEWSGLSFEFPVRTLEPLKEEK